MLKVGIVLMIARKLRVGFAWIKQSILGLLLNPADVDYFAQLFHRKFGAFLYFDVDAAWIEKKSIHHQYFLRRKIVPYDFNPLGKTFEHNNPYGQELGIVIQGPVKLDENYTERLIDHYLKVFPRAKIILSTWDGQVPIAIENRTHTDENFHLVTSKIPQHKGISNINLQITSSLNGVLRAQDLGCKFVLKTRTDQFIADLQALNKIHTLYNKYGEGPAGNRILISDRNTFVFRLYGVSDMFMFGRIADLLKYWNIPHDSREKFESEIDGSLRAYGKLNVVESYLSTHYLRTMGHEPQFTLEDSLKCFRDYFCVINAHEIKLRWDKYTNANSQWNVSYYPSKFQEMSFLDWLGLTTSIDDILAFEEILDRPDDF